MENFCGYRLCEKSNLKSPSFFVCNRCQAEFYCSKKCQIKAFATHRYSCFELPALCPIASQDSTQPTPSTNLMNELNREEKQLQIVEHQMVQLTTNETGIETTNNETQTNDSSLSNNAEVTITNNEEREPEFKKPDGFSKKFPTATRVNSNDLRSKNSFVFNPMKTATSEQIRETTQRPKQTRFYFTDLKQKPLPRLKFQANVLSGDVKEKMFTLTEKGNQEILPSIESAIERITANNNVGGLYEPEEGEIVLGRYEGNFFRGVCREVKNDSFLIYYIDYGNTEIVQKQDITKISEELLEFDLFLHQCFVENFPDQMNKKAAEVLGNENGVEVIDARKDFSGNFYIVRILGL